MKERKKEFKSKYLLMLIFVVVLWGVAPNVSTLVLHLISPSLKSAIYSFICFVAMLIICRKRLKELNKEYFKVAVPTGIFYSLACVMQSIGLTKTTPILYSFLENLSCIVVPLLVWRMTKIRPTLFKLISALLCIVSVLILSANGSSLKIQFGIGEILCGLAGIFYGVNIAVTGIKAKQLNAGLYLLIQFGIQFIISTIYAVLFEDMFFVFEFKTFALSIFSALIFTVLGWMIRTVCLKHIDPSLVSVIMPFSSVVTAVISVIAGNDVLSTNLVVGAVIGLIAVMISDYVPKKKVKKPSEEKVNLYDWE